MDNIDMLVLMATGEFWTMPSWMVRVFEDTDLSEMLVEQIIDEVLREERCVPVVADEAETTPVPFMTDAELAGQKIAQLYAEVV